ncbi:MAG: DUF2939 domain-containing protein [Hyphomicrobiaceae bacterium]
MKRLILLVLLLAIGFYVAWPAFTGYRIYQGLEGNDPATLAAKIDFPSVRQSMRGPVLAQVNTRIETVMKELGPATQVVGDQIPRDNIEKIIDGALATVVEPKRIAEIYANGGDINAAIKEAVLEEIDKMGGLVKVLKLDKLLAQGSERDGAGASVGGIKIPGGLGKLLQNKEVSDAIGNAVGKFALDPGKMAGKLFPASDASSGAAKPSGKPSYGIDNVKSFSFPSATAMQVGVARSPAAADPEVTAELAFRNYDWRVTKLVPNLLEK